MLDIPIAQIAERVVRGEVSAVQMAEASLAAINEGRRLNAFVHVAEETALEAARQLDERRKRGEPLGRLAGVPIAVKDALCTIDAPTTCASRILIRAEGDPSSGLAKHGWRPPFDATVVKRLRQEGALLIGKTNMDEFAMGSSTENSAFGPTLNPWDTRRIAGGSSGGSAAAVAARLAPGSIGSDTGGSIRQPAGLCGVVGVKPSYGRVSRYGLVAFASSLDQIGPLATDVRGAARLLGVMAGYDPRDSTSVDHPVPDYEAACDLDVRGLRIGIPEEYFGPGLDPQVGQRVQESLDALKRQGCQLTSVRLPHTQFGVATYYIVATAEASSNLARFDGVRFGLRASGRNDDLRDMYASTRGAGFGKEVKRRILLGTYVLSAGYYEAYYLKAQRVRTLIRRDFEDAFKSVDAIATPVSPTVAFRLGEHVEDPLAMYLGDIFTLPCSLAGICGISVPVRPATLEEPGRALPVGLQLMAPAFREETLFTIAAAWERLLGGFPAPPTWASPKPSDAR